jgi:hypothetical protein
MPQRKPSVRLRAACRQAQAGQELTDEISVGDIPVPGDRFAGIAQRHRPGQGRPRRQHNRDNADEKTAQHDAPQRPVI